MTTNRKKFIETLENYNASEYEKPIVKELLDYVKTDENCFERIMKEGAKHIGATTLVVNEKDEGLFLWHSKIQEWVSPGGHCDGNDNILEVALTELEEETGLKNAKIDPIPLEIRKYDYEKSVYGYQKSVYNVAFLARVNTAEETPRICEPDKCEKMVWMTKQEAFKELQSSSYERSTNLIEKWMKK